MFDIGLPELMIILVLGLVLLGPDRLPGVIRQFTGFIRMLRSSYGDALAVFKDQLGDVQEDIDAIRGEISSIQGEVRSTAEDVQKDVEKVESEVKTAGADIQRGLDETAKEAGATRPDQIGAETNAPAAVPVTRTPARPTTSERGAAWTPQGAQSGGGSPLQQDLFAGLMRSLKTRLGDDWLEEQADIYRDLGARAAERNADDDQDIAALVRSWADMHRNSLPEGSLQIIETGKDYRVRMRQCPFSFAETDDVALCQSCSAYDLAFLQERSAEVKWDSHLTAGDPWCELVFAKPPPPPKPEPVAAEPTVAEDGDGASASAEAAQPPESQERASADEATKEVSEFASLAEGYSAPADEPAAPKAAAQEQSGADSIKAEDEEANAEDGAVQAAAAEPATVEASADSDAAEKAGSGKKESSA
ncbi:MAG: hypothetical protein OXK81_00690 [Chloroflexota bacterium]|nr:hypothetical protein [Chloroflexota bacterium]MDE2930197.1 hypothetical protein [Chloroflexota bacterium]